MSLYFVCIVAQAIGLWDNMLTPVGKKDDTWVADRAPLEPFPDTVFATTFNSKKSSQLSTIHRELPRRNILDSSVCPMASRKISDG